MPRAGWVKPRDDQRLSDHVALGVLTRAFPPELVDAVVAETGRQQQRSRLLPSRLVVYYVLAMALFSESSYEEVARNLVEGLAWQSGWQQRWRVPSKSAIFYARERLGAEAVAELFARGCVPLAAADTPGGFYRQWRLVSLDGTCLDVADTPANDRFFGRPGVNKGERSAFPQARVVGLVECGTHVLFDAEVGPYTTSEGALSAPLLDRLAPGMVLLADRGLAGFALWRRAAATGADLLWRVKNSSTGLKPHPVEELTDGSWLARIDPPKAQRKTVEPMIVRVVDYTIEDGREADGAYRLFTTITDPEQATATDLALAYAQRWEIESVFDELKTHQRGPKTVLRSKSPPLVLQEIWGHLCCHYAIRTLMAETAAQAGEDPDRVSFVAALRIARRSIAHQGDFPPS
jgi:hypothetical protein